MRYFDSSLVLILSIIFLNIRVSFSIKENYYWREYTGLIPPDAIVGGKDISGNNLYIGQAYVKNLGLQVVPIYVGVKEVYAVLAGARKVEKYIKILCGPQENFRWVLTNYKDLQKTLKDKHAVIGGHEDLGQGPGLINIGRISYEGETKIGKVNAFKIGESRMFFYDKGLEKGLDKHSFEVLCYDRKPLIDPRQTATTVFSLTTTSPLK